MSDDADIDPTGLVRLDKIGGPDFVKRMIDLFLEEIPKRLAAAREGERSGDYAAIEKAAHEIKTSAYNFGASGLGFRAERLEVAMRSGCIENLSTMLDDFEQSYGPVKSWLEIQRGKLPP